MGAGGFWGAMTLRTTTTEGAPPPPLLLRFPLTRLHPLRGEDDFAAAPPALLWLLAPFFLPRLKVALFAARRLPPHERLAALAIVACVRARVCVCMRARLCVSGVE